MTAASAVVSLETMTPITRAVEVLDGEVIYGMAYCGLRDQTGTTTEQGRLQAFEASSGVIPFGFGAQLNAITGSLSADPIVKSYTTTSRGGYKLAITGLAGTFDDVGRLVYASDDNGFTFTRAAKYALVGQVVGFISSTYAWVEAFGNLDQTLLAMSGQGRETKLIGIATAVAVSGGAAATVNYPGYTASHKEKLNSFWTVGAIVATGGAASGGATQTVITAKIGVSGAALTGTAISGATLTMTKDMFAVGTYTAGGTIAAAATTNLLTEGKNIIIEGNPSVTGSAGMAMVYGIFQNDIGV